MDRLVEFRTRPIARERTVAGGAITLIGLTLLAVLLFTLWRRYSLLHKPLPAVLVENAVFLVSGCVVASGGIWLTRSDWETHYVTTVAKWTILGWTTATAVFGLVLYIQSRVLGNLQPYVIAMDGVLLGTTVTFALGVFSAQRHMTQSDLDGERETTATLQTLHDTAIELTDADTTDEVYETALTTADTLVSPQLTQLRHDNTVVAERGHTAATTTHNPVTTLLGDRGRLQLYLDRELSEREEMALDLLGTYVDRSLARIAREQELDARSEKLSFINHTLRHDLENDLFLLDARLTEVESSFDTNPDHWAVITDRVQDMQQFLETIQGYLDIVDRDDPELEPVDLEPTLTERVDLIEESFPDAVIEYEDVPAVSVRADDLLGHVFENLLRNAIEHNDAETPTVRVTGWVEMETVTVEVSDTGPGLSAAQKAAIRSDTPTEDSDRVGFGLHLVTETIRTYGGSLDVRDNTPRGTTIRVTLERPDRRPVESVSAQE